MDRLEVALTTFIEHTDQDIAEMRQWRVQAQKQWGEIANRLGTFVEDIVAPNIPRIGNVPDHIVKYCTRHRIYALGLGPETMQLLNRIDMLPSSAPPA